MVGKKEKEKVVGVEEEGLLNLVLIYNKSIILHTINKFQQTSIGSSLDAMNMIKENSNGLTCISGYEIIPCKYQEYASLSFRYFCCSLF